MELKEGKGRCLILESQEPVLDIRTYISAHHFVKVVVSEG